MAEAQKTSASQPPKASQGRAEMLLACPRFSTDAGEAFMPSIVAANGKNEKLLRAGDMVLTCEPASAMPTRLNELNEFHETFQPTGGRGQSGGDCALLPRGAWGRTLITNYPVNPGGSISVPLECGARRIMRLKLNPE